MRNCWQRKNFCNFVVSNDYSNERNEFFARLNAHRPVDSGGGYMNNIGGPVTDKLAFQRGYKFSIAYENSRGPGYCTEKIVDALCRSHGAHLLGRAGCEAGI